MRVWRRFFPGRSLPIWYDPAYRLALPALESAASVEPRRADFVAYLLERMHVIGPGDLRAPTPIPYADLARVHTPEYLESLQSSETLARIFAADPSEIRVDEILHTVRLATGATVGAARESLSRRGPSLNLLGGFHHAAPERGGGLCAVNDIAVAVAAVRAEGFAGQVVVLDLDAHPPDGTAACLGKDPRVWIGSLSGSHWGDLPGVEERVLPERAGDGLYVGELARLLARMPRPELAFVIAGGDVLGGDKMGRLGLTLDGARRRDLRVLQALTGVASVWLPGGGYSPDAWKVLAGTGLALAGRGREAIRRVDPLAMRFTGISGELEPHKLTEGIDLSLEDLEAELRGVRANPRFLSYYTAEGLEYAVDRYGLLDFLRRLGYSRFRVAIDPSAAGGDRARLYGRAAGAEHLLIELVVEKRLIDGAPYLYVHWTSLRHPTARFHPSHPRLPGQDVPGLGLAREMSQLYERIASRLGLKGVAFRPSFYHIAYVARHRMQFFDAARQGRFEAMVRDLRGVPLGEATNAVAEGRVMLHGQPYVWEADLMAAALDRPADAERDAAIAAAREGAHFTLAERADPATIPA